MMKKPILAAVIALAVALLAFLAWKIWDQSRTIDIMSATFQMEKEEMLDEYSDLAIQYEGYKLNVNNDSLEQKLEDQRIKIQRLVDELKQTKADDARKIAALKKELKTVREALRYYVAQVDSLNKINQALVAENSEVKAQIQQVQTTNRQIREQNQQLTEQVSLAAQLTVSGMRATAVTRKSKATDSLKKTEAFQIDFTINANVTAEIGSKDIYCCIIKPNGDLLVNDRSGKFSLDGSMISYSMKKTIEFGGQETPVTLYWNRNEALSPGNFEFHVYADGSEIASTTLSMKK